MESVVHIIVAVLLLTGGFFVFVGSVGLLKLPDFFTRLHAPTKATTMGIGAILLASMVLTTMRDGHLSIHELVISLFLFITAPVSAHMLAKAALHRRVKFLDHSKNAQLAARAAEQKTPE
ncbi:Na+/H+ antiporter subunit G [Thalassolituus hydrocarboniclasticus]|uniref:Na+/H+ antiporter subunit G n=1 Tax=Thalassolituus hydrocarboniclasticus TaxID=2742796 RepID=A0ABY6A801_9GAMM|nr:Na+/H+ antiporter subunit G [Thalassolituus hydrocarboniclasticus]UXD86258.1 Na+/H+ antiporter subunit G [Thalassolituus hydrocarboniclasticus]